MGKLIFLTEYQRQRFWWDVFFRNELGREVFVGRTKTGSSDQAVKNVWRANVRNLHRAVGEFGAARLRMYARLSLIKPAGSPGYQIPRNRGKLCNFR